MLYLREVIVKPKCFISCSSSINNKKKILITVSDKCSNYASAKHSYLANYTMYTNYCNLKKDTCLPLV